MVRTRMRKGTDDARSPVETIIVRMFYSVDRGRTGRISLQDWKRSNLLEMLELAEASDDVNSVPPKKKFFFSSSGLIKKVVLIAGRGVFFV